MENSLQYRPGETFGRWARYESNSWNANLVRNDTIAKELTQDLNLPPFLHEVVGKSEKRKSLTAENLVKMDRYTIQQRVFIIF